MSCPLAVSHRNGNILFYFEQLSSNVSLDGFSCLIAEYNNYLFEDALRSQNDHIALTWLLKERTTGIIAAYMSLIADAIKLNEIIGVYDDHDEAFMETIKVYTPGTFMIHDVPVDIEDEIAYLSPFVF